MLSRDCETQRVVGGYCHHHAANHQDIEERYRIELESLEPSARAIWRRSAVARKDLRERSLPNASTATQGRDIHPLARSLQASHAHLDSLRPSY
jgi:hypothetical protein